MITRSEVAATACADLFRGSGAILASSFGVVPTIGVRLARLTHAPELLLSDGDATLFADTPAVDRPFTRPEGHLPYAKLFELIATGRRHVIMGAPQIDRHGNQNLSAIGPRDRPTHQLVGARGAATNTANHATSYFVPRHSTRVFVPEVDTVTGVGADRAARLGMRFHDLRGVVTNLAVLDLAGADGTMRLVSVHPGVRVDEVVAATGFPLDIPTDVPLTRVPDEQELHLIRTVLDPRGLRSREVPDV
ncbi:CoA-transferase [Microbacterium sp. NPDC028030]|uniref:CoA-transferase subunit beta n=1 Tax=Microbacterium sp. NPDC028030 TaxID=3155124 RepID=UPI00340DEA79